MFFYPDSLVDGTKFYIAIKSFNFQYRFGGRMPKWNRPMNIEDCFKYLTKLRPYFKTDSLKQILNLSGLEKKWNEWGLKKFDPKRSITRRELSVMLDKCILLFGTKNLLIDINGKVEFVYNKF
jgi:hypothetical protein